MAKTFTDLGDIFNKVDNELAADEILAEEVPTDEYLDADQWNKVGKVIGEIENAINDIDSKMVKSIKQGVNEYLPVNNTVQLPGADTQVSILCNGNIKDIVSVDGTCKIDLAFTSVEGGTNTFELVDVEIQTYENGEYTKIGSFVAATSDYNNPTFKTYNLTDYGLKIGNYENLLIFATGRQTIVNGRYLLSSIALTELKITLGRDYHVHIDASQQTSGFPLVYNIKGSVAKTLKIFISGAAGIQELTYNLDKSVDNQTVRYTIPETSAYKIMSHGVHQVVAYMFCSDGRGGTLYSNVLVNTFMVLNENTAGADLTQPYFLLQYDTSYENYSASTLTKVTNFVQASLFEYAVYSPRVSDTGKILNDGQSINVSFLLTSADDGNNHWDDEYFKITSLVAPATKASLQTTVEIEAEEGASAVTYYDSYLRVYRTTDDNREVDFLQESINVTNKYIKVDNTDSFSPLSGSNFLINPKVRNNTEANPARILNARANNAEVTSTWTGFGFVNDGWITSPQDKQKVLRVPAGTSLNIAFNPFLQFRTSPDSGMTIDIDFAVRNVTNEDDPIISIFEMVTGYKRGIVIKPIEGAVYTASNTVEQECSFFWQEDKRTHISININNAVSPGGVDALHPASSTTYDLAATSLPLVRVFLNGVIVREMKYDVRNNAEFCTDDMSNGGITIGQNGADIDIYSIRCYQNNQLTTSEILQNYISTLPTSDEKVAIREANNILVGGRIDLAKVKEKGKKCLIWHGSEPYKFATGESKGWWEIFQYKEDGTLDKEVSGTICKEKKCLSATRQGSTANTYYYSNIQTKIKDVADDKNNFIKVNVDDLHSSIHLVGEPFAETKKNEETGLTEPTGNMLIKIYGGNLGKQYPVYEDETHTDNYQYIEEDDKKYVMVPDGWVDGNGKYRGLGYLVQKDLPLGQKFVLKINYASCMQSHLLGCTRAYSDLHKLVVGPNGIQSNPNDDTLSVKNARTAKYTEPFFFFTQAEGSSNVYFRGPGTFGPGKMDKPTWGYDKKTHKMFCLIEGSDNNYELTDFLVPWDTNEIYYSPGDEGWFHYGLQGWDFDAGATNVHNEGATDEYETPKEDYMVRIREIFNWVYMHSTALGVYTGTFDNFKKSPTYANNLKTKYWCTSGADAYKLKRYRYFKYIEEVVAEDGSTSDLAVDLSDWIDAGLPNGREQVTNAKGLPLYWKDMLHSKCSVTPTEYPVYMTTFDEIDMTSHEIFKKTYDDTINRNQYSALNTEFINAIVAHAKKYIGFYIKPESLRFHYCFINALMCGTDNCSKNTYYVLDPVAQDVTIDGVTKKCYLLELHQDDVDTIFGTDNNGRTTKPYYIDRMHQFRDGDSATSLYEGNANVLFNLCEKMYESTKELQSTMKSIFTAMTQLVNDNEVIPGMESASSNISLWGFFHKYFFSVQRYFPIVAWNETARIRYEYPKMLGYISIGSGARGVDPITQSLGDQLQSETQYMKRRLIYMTSYAAWGQLYDGGKTLDIGIDDVGESFSMQAFHLPHEEQSNIEYKFNVKPHQYIYPTGMAGQTPIDPHTRVAPGETYTLSLGSTSSNDTGMSINGINYYRSIGNIGDLSTTPNNTLTVNGKRLVEFIAEPTKTYEDSITHEQVPAFRPGSVLISATRLDKFSLKGCKQIGGSINASNLSRLQTIDLRNTNINACTLPLTSTLTNIYFPTNFTSLDFEDLVNLAEIDLQASTHINSIIIKNCSQYAYEYVLDLVNRIIR